MKRMYNSRHKKEKEHAIIYEGPMAVKVIVSCRKFVVGGREDC